MLHISLLVLTLFGGVLVEPFRIAQAEPGHHQACLRAAMADDGRFAIAWVDSLSLNDPSEPNKSDLELFVRFFDRDGTPLTEAYKIAKFEDTNWIYHPSLDINTAGNSVLAWVEAAHQHDLDKYIRFQAFAPDGSPAGSAQTLTSQVNMN